MDVKWERGWWIWTLDDYDMKWIEEIRAEGHIATGEAYLSERRDT